MKQLLEMTSVRESLVRTAFFLYGTNAVAGMVRVFAGALMVVALFALIYPMHVNADKYDLETFLKEWPRNDALGAWLPSFGDGFDPWRQGISSSTKIDESFLYGGNDIRNGTPFSHGDAGPPRGSVLYDRVHRIALYTQGCCAWRSTAAAADTSPPPSNVRESDLHALRTKHGIRLGDTSERVMNVFGKATFHAVQGHPNLRMLSYTYGVRSYAEDAKKNTNSCGNFQNFVFRKSSLIFIELMWGC